MFHTLCLVFLQTPAALPAESAPSALVERVRASEYHYSAVAAEPGVYSAPNRAQELRSRVSPRGIEVFPRQGNAGGAGAEWRAELRTKTFGREGFAEELPPSVPVASGARIELAHGLLTEWFENRPEGIEQGWTIAAAPGGSERLWIGLELTGGLALRVEDGARSGTFVDGAGTARLRYRDLRAWDAEGRELEARLLPSPGGLGIAVDALGAVYPLTVDPLFTLPAWGAVGGQAFANFGIAVSSAGDVNGDGYSDVIVGASFYDNGETDEGRAFVYHGSAGGLSLTANWSAESDQAGAEFGDAVSTAGDVNGDGYSDVIVGAPLFDSVEGRAFVYLGSPTGLASSPAWALGSGQAASEFGRPVSTAGDVNGDGYSDVIVGAYAYSNGEASEGRVFVYHGSPTGPGLVPAWTNEPDQVGALYGNTCSTAGDVNGDGYDDVVVCSLYYDNGQTNEGRAFVYHGSAAGLAVTTDWTYETDQAFAYLQIGASAGDVNGDGFGDVVVAATDYDNGEVDEGIAIVFLGSAGGLPASGTVLEVNQAGAFFGARATTAGDVDGDGYGDLIVGAPGFDNGHTDEGQARLYRGTSSGISTTPSFLFDPDQTNARFGRAVACAGDVNGDGYSDVMVGAHRYTSGLTEEGAAAVFHGGPGTLLTTPAWTAEGDQAGADLGVSVAGAGDVNGDGYSDVIVGADLYDHGQVDEGRAFLHLGSAAGLSVGAAWTAEGDQAGAQFGIRVAAAGDVNGDGYSDVIVGADLYDNGQADEGRAYLYLGSGSGLSPGAAWTAESDQAGARFGSSVAKAGDVNGDGYGDVIVGAYLFDNGQADEGRAFLYMGSAAGLSASSVWTAESDQVEAFSGLSVATAGDVNGDGYSDVVVSSYWYDGGQANEGRASLYLGSSAGLSISTAWTAEGDQADALFGISLASAGDVNGDGYSDLIVGSYLYDNGQADEGRAFLYLGTGAGLSAGAAWTAEGDQASAQFGVSVAAAGDVNGDGYGDVVVGARFHDNGETDEGRALLYLGSATGLSTSAAWTSEGNQVGAAHGLSVASAGDVNGDGYADVLVGADLHDNDQTDEGRALLYLGNEIGAPTLRPRQRRTTGAPLDLLDQTSPSFLLGAQFERDLAGFSWARPGPRSVRLQWEVARLGGAFDGVPDGESTPQAITGATLAFDEFVGGLQTEELYHWRARFATDDPLYPNSPWFTIQGRTTSESKFRTRDARIRPSGVPAGP